MPYLTMGDGIRLYYENYGDGETLIFCHGLGSRIMRIGTFMIIQR